MRRGEAYAWLWRPCPKGGIFTISEKLGSTRRANHPAIGLIFNSFHILASKTRPVGHPRHPVGRSFLVQMADAPVRDMEYLSWSRHHRCFPGQGELPIDDLCSRFTPQGSTVSLP